MKNAAGLIAVGIANKEPVAILRRRGTFQIVEKDGKLAIARESFPGDCQVTAHGGMENADNGDFLANALREAQEEIGYKPETPLTQNEYVEVASSRKEDVPAVGDKPAKEGKEVHTFGIKFGEENFPVVLDRLRLEASTGGLVLLQKSQLDQLRPLNPKTDKADGAHARHIKETVEAYFANPTTPAELIAALLKEPIFMFDDEIAAVKKAFELLT